MRATVVCRLNHRRRSFSRESPFGLDHFHVPMILLRPLSNNTTQSPPRAPPSCGGKVQLTKDGPDSSHGSCSGSGSLRGALPPDLVFRIGAALFSNCYYAVGSCVSRLTDTANRSPVAAIYTAEQQPVSTSHGSNIHMVTPLVANTHNIVYPLYHCISFYSLKSLL